MNNCCLRTRGTKMTYLQMKMVKAIKTNQINTELGCLLARELAQCIEHLAKPLSKNIGSNP